MIALARRPVRPPGELPAGAPVARLVGVSARRGSRTVLTDVDLDVRAGEVLAVAGPNGAGKSTLVALLAGDLAPTAGQVELHGQPLRSWSATERGMRRSVLLQSNPVAFPFTVEEVVRMGRAPWRGTPAADDDDRLVEHALATVDLVALRHRPLPRLSGGEQARAALARALAQDAGLALLDEPTAALDLPHADAALRHARRLADAGRAVVTVLHDLNLAGAHADRVALVADGHLAALGSPGDVLTEPVLSAAYGAGIEVVEHPRTGAPLVMSRPPEATPRSSRVAGERRRADASTSFQ